MNKELLKCAKLSIYLILLLLLVKPIVVFAQFSGGSGTLEYPWKISTIEELQEVKNYLDGHFVQINDIDASATATWNDGKGFEPIGWYNGFNTETHFSGVYDGQHYSIQNLNVNRPDSNITGLFGFINGASLLNITLDNATITGKSSVGGIAGMAWSSEILQIKVEGTIKGIFSVGGLIGSTSETDVLKSSTTVAINGTDDIGGLIGSMESGYISQSSTSGQINGERKLGGLVGTWMSNFSSISNSYSQLNISGISSVGGLIGEAGSLIETGYGLIEYSYAAGQIQADDLKGAIAGNVRLCLIITASYWDDTIVDEISIGSQWNEVCIDCLGIENVDEVQHVRNLNTTQMSGQNAYTTMFKLDYENIWQLTDSYPMLQWQNAGNAIQPPNVSILQAKTNTLNFGKITVGVSDTLDVYFTNTGQKSMFFELGLNSGSTTSFFLNGYDKTTTLGANDTLHVNVIFAPDSPIEHNAILEVNHDASNSESPFQVHIQGNGIVGSTLESETIVPTKVQLYPNYPNPFNPQTQLSYSLSESSLISLEVFDLMGRRVSTLVNSYQTAGSYRVSFDASKLASGVYVYRLITPKKSIRRLMTLLK